MVYHRDTAAVKYLLKEKGFLKGKGKQNKPKAKKEISMKNITNISTGHNSVLEDEDEFTIVIPSRFLKPNEAPAIDRKTHSIKKKETDIKKPDIKNCFRETYVNQNYKSFGKHNQIPKSSINKDSKPNNSSISSKINVKSDDNSIYEDDCNDEFTIKICPEQLKLFYKKYDQVSVNSSSSFSTDEDLQSNGSSTIWEDWKTQSRDTDNTASSSDYLVSVETDEDDDDEFMIPIPKDLCTTLGI